MNNSRLHLHPLHGRGASANPKNRFEAVHYEAVGETLADEAECSPRTQFLPDSSKSIIATNDSPDIPFDCSINPYRGCEHGCAYCYARPTHEYLGLSAGLDFETRILVKHDAPALLRAALMAKSWQPKNIAFSGVTDCYQPIERKLRLTRQCLQVLQEFKNPASFVTKNALIARDLDVLRDMAAWGGMRVFISITTLDSQLTRILEPRTSVPARRLWAVEQLANAGVPVGVMVAPVIPAITDHEMLGIMKAARDAGAISAGYVALRLPHGMKELFESLLEQHFPDRREKVLNRVREMHGGELYRSTFGNRQRGEGEFADQFSQMFKLGCERFGLNTHLPPLNCSLFRRPLAEGEQLPLF